MKRNISINIGGIIFHIEEDGYDKLKSYLDSINSYFSNFEDSKEIIDDIENRIAELLLQKLSDGKQVVIVEDIDELISTMGTVSDFQASIEIEEPEEPKQAKTSQSYQGQSSGNQQHSKSEEDTGKKRLHRDVDRRILGGVASGMAYYFGIDPLWIRLVFLALLFNLFFVEVSGLVVLAYIILWIVVPGKSGMEEDKSVKKLYRNPDERVLGGVASGIASYFGTDITVIRVLFILGLIPAGAGFFLYIVLWIITPEAKTITEKMQMQGEPVTLTNIEKNVKKSLNVEEGEESAGVKILLFPFRLIAIVIKGLGEVLGPLLKFLVEAIRIAFGAFISLLGFTFVISLVVVLGVMLGLKGEWSDYVYVDELPIELFSQTVDPLGAIALFLVFLIPALVLVLLGVMVIVKRKVGNAYIGWSLFGLWIVSLLVVAFMVPKTIRQFSVEDDINKDQFFNSDASTVVLKLSDQEDSPYDGVDLRIRGHEDSVFKAAIRLESRGENPEDARMQAEKISYTIAQQDSIFLFDSEIDFRDAGFRFQRASVIFYVPFGQPFQMDYELRKILINTLSRDGYWSRDLQDNTWMVTKDGLECTTCPKPEEEEKTDIRSMNSDDLESDVDWTKASGRSQTYEFENFEEILATSLVNIKVIQSNDYNVEIVAPDDLMEKVFVKQFGDRLEIEYKNDWNWMDDNKYKGEKIWAFVSAPNLEELEIVGGCKAEIQGFENQDLLLIATGASSIYANVNPDFMDVRATGASRIKLR
jgi:phage shock protein PspC (stress-responsive transcriptional regulator)